MPLILHKVKNYNDELQKFCAKNEKFESKVYYNKDDTPTIGYGLALYNIKTGEKVQDAFEDLEKAGIKISAADKKILDKIETAMQTEPRNDTTIKELVNQLTLDLGSKQKGKELYNFTAERYETATKNALGTTLYDSLKDTKELVALADLAYNGGGGIIGSGMKHALEHWSQNKEALGIILSDKKVQSQADPSNKSMSLLHPDTKYDNTQIAEFSTNENKDDLTSIEGLAYVPGITILPISTTIDAKDVVLASNTSNTDDNNNNRMVI